MLFVSAETLTDSENDILKLTYLPDDEIGEESGDFHDEIDIVSIEIADDGNNKTLRLTFAVRQSSK